MKNAPWHATITDADPDHVLAYRDDDDTNPRRVAVTKRRQRWQQLRKALDAMPWTRLEACDDEGGVIAVWPQTPRRASGGPPPPPPLPAEWQAPSQAIHAAFVAGGANAHAQTAQLIEGYQGLLQALVGSVGDLRGLVQELAKLNATVIREVTRGDEGPAPSGGGGEDMGLVSLFRLVQEGNAMAAARRERSKGPPPRPAPRPGTPRPTGPRRPEPQPPRPRVVRDDEAPHAAAAG